MLAFILLSGVGTVLKWDVFWAFGKNILFPSSGWKTVGPGSSCVICAGTQTKKVEPGPFRAERVDTKGSVRK
jgi:hypothetical protein